MRAIPQWVGCLVILAKFNLIFLCDLFIYEVLAGSVPYSNVGCSIAPTCLSPLIRAIVPSCPYSMHRAMFRCASRLLLDLPSFIHATAQWRSYYCPHCFSQAFEQLTGEDSCMVVTARMRKASQPMDLPTLSPTIGLVHEPLSDFPSLSQPKPRRIPLSRW